MTKNYIVGTLAMVALGVLVAGCYSPHTTTRVGPRKIKIIDSLTKCPITGAQVALSGPSAQQGLVTNERGFIQLYSYGLYIGPKYDAIQVAKDGYGSVSFRLTNGLPRQIALTPLLSPK